VVEEVARDRLETPSLLHSASRRQVARSAGGKAAAMAYVYILLCNDRSYYVGSTTADPELRVWQHNNDDVAGAAYTRRRRPVRLVWSAEFGSVIEAFAFEKRVHGWSRAKREALIRGDFEALPGLAKRRTSSTDRWE